MTKSKKLTILGIVLIAVGCFFAGKTYGADEEILVDNSIAIGPAGGSFGWYGQKISDGTYIISDAAFAQVYFALGAIGDFKFDANAEFIVDTSFDRMDYSIGSTLGDFSTRLWIKDDERLGTALEVEAQYGFSNSFFDTTLAVTLADQNWGDNFKNHTFFPSLTVSKGLDIRNCEIRLGGQYGQSLLLDDDYSYLRAFSRLSVSLNEKVDIFGELNLLKNSSINLDFDQSFYAGVVGKF